MTLRSILIKKICVFTIFASVFFVSNLVASDLSGLEGADKVFVYYYNVEGNGLERIFTADGELSKTVVSVKVLNSTQRHNLLQLFKIGGPDHMPYMCFNPRHAFVFEFDADKKKTIEVCFECLSSNIPYENRIENVNYFKLGEFVDALGLDLGPKLDLPALKTKYLDSVEHLIMLKEKHSKSKLEGIK